MNGDIFYLPEEEYQKAVWQLRANVVGVFDFLKVDDNLPVRYFYGMGDYIPGAINEIVKLAEDFSLRVRGQDKPISIDYVRRKRWGKENS